MNPEDILRTVAEQVSTCQRCTLHHTRKRSVPGEGRANAQVMLIGEGPGFHENEQGRPFVGQAGKFLDELLQMAGLKREEVFIANVVKCRPPGNRDPEPDELAACGEYLQQQIDTINPRVIVTLGRFSMARFFPNARISYLHGQSKWIGGRLVVAMYHPAAALHNPALKTAILTDFSRLPRIMEQAAKADQANLASMAPQQPEPVPAVAEARSLFDLPAIASNETDSTPASSAPTQLPLF
ncbi:MAG TPA: uracil-DNA glycosylase [Levilinea sp.]|nr:uracil-DNA glycosylase [Levilinea sp.]